MNVRLQKYLAEAGVASRRAAEEFILAGRVAVNAQTIRALGTKVEPDRDAVAVDGKLVRPRRKIYIALHKPVGCVCSRNDELGRRTIYDFLPVEWRIAHSVGRLDFDSEGLIFLTNDGEFALRLTHPRYGVRKKYLATVQGRVERVALEKLVCGLVEGGDKLKALSARRISPSQVELELCEGKNREVRRLLQSQGLTVTRLRRTQIGKIKLGELKPGRWRALTETEIKTLLLT